MLFYIDHDHKTPPKPENKIAIVSIVIGKTFIDTWERLCRKGWERYAKECGFDIIVITIPLDTSERAQNRSPAWQKMLVLSQPWARKYKRIICMDADIMITPAAQNILDYCPDETKVSISESGDKMSASERHIYLERLKNVGIRADCDEAFWVWENKAQFQLYHIESESGVMFNTGVLVVSPKHHKALFEEVYAQEDVEGGRLYEQPYFSYVLDKRGLAHKISARFNWGILEMMALYMPDKLFKPAEEFSEFDTIVLRYLIRREYSNAFFLHFYGAMGVMMGLPMELFE